MKDTSSTTQRLLEASRRLAMVAPQESFVLWKRKDFRLLTDFATLSQTEQDRIFNELQVSVLGLYHIHFLHIATIADKEFKNALTLLKREIIAAFISLLSEQKVEEQFITLWEQLIDMRLKEYERDYKIALSETNAWEEFKHDSFAKTAWARIETITIDCLSHIRRGKVKKGDLLWRLLRKWFITLDTQIMSIERLANEDVGKN